MKRKPSPVIRLNLAAAIAMAGGPDVGLQAIAAIDEEGDLTNYHLLPAARAELHRRAGRRAEAAEHYRKALALAQNDRERAYLRRRLLEMEAAASDP